MLTPLTLIPLVPLGAFVILTLAGFRLPKVVVAVIAVGATAAAFVCTALAGVDYLSHHAGGGQAVTETLYQWLSVGGFSPAIAFTLDPLSLVMCSVVTFVGMLILLYATQFMAADEGYARFFAFMSLFIASMLVLVLADNLLLLYLGWEGVGLCSYLLIGFWYRERANAAAALKAFLVTRVGDVALAIGMFVIYGQLGTLNLAEIAQRAPLVWTVGSAMAVAAAALLLGGAVGKSAQLPLHVWLPDAMAGPTPVSALIHAATMVTAGVYLIARTYAIFELAPIVLWIVGLIGTVTLLVAACSALTQRDLKRVLAYSTMSQIGYMFLGLGVGAWSAAIFHLFTHAFFKSLLFLGAGVIITSLHEEHDIFKMGGLRRKLPLVFWTFLVGCASLSAVPWITGGFFSKEEILNAAWRSGNVGLWLGGVIGAMLTSLYSFRMVFLVFFGEGKREPQRARGWAVALPLVVLAAFAVGAGHVALPTAGAHGEGGGHGSLVMEGVAVAASLLGILIAAVLYLKQPERALALGRTPLVESVKRFWLQGWGFDRLYRFLFVRPLVFLAQINRGDFIDGFYTGLAALIVTLHYVLGLTQTGRVRTYAAAIGFGVVILLAVVMLR
jgi:NADH-quinone oxidoreductase subunit L